MRYIGLGLILLPHVGWAAGSSDTGALQQLRPSTTIYLDVLSNKETLSWFAQIETSTGDVTSVDADVYAPSGAYLATWSSGTTATAGDLAGPGVYRFEPIGVDAYGPAADGAADAGAPDGVIDPINNWDLSVLDVPDDVGRVWSTKWRFDAGRFTAPYALTGSFYVLVPGGDDATTGVIEMAVQGLAGNTYDVMANAVGATNGDLTAAGRSRLQVSWDLIPEYAVYLRPPQVATFGMVTPALTNVEAIEILPCDKVLPYTDSLELRFDSNIEGHWHLNCDVDGDGLFDPVGPSDRLTVGSATPGFNTVVWDGTTSDGLPFPNGDHQCVLRLIAGEVHWVASDIETSFEGLRLFKHHEDRSVTAAGMLWNDDVVQGDAVTMPNESISLARSTPTGFSSGDPSDSFEPNVNARSWGNFTNASKGDQAFLDTWTWLDQNTSEPFTLSFANADSDSDGDGLSDDEELCLTDTPTDNPDADGDGITDGSEIERLGTDPLNADTDGDGLSDLYETPSLDTPPDTDGDGLIDALDSDDDGDGIETRDEDLNGDGIYSEDGDGDGIPDYLDEDDDNDLVLTRFEDLNGTGDARDDDTDGDLLPNYRDDDDDDDGQLTREEDPDGDGNPRNDNTDRDDLPNYLDDDDDGDLLPSSSELGRDSDGDGTPDVLDDDDDNDSVPTRLEDHDGDGDPSNDDNDIDGLIDALDDDDDNDGLLTIVEDRDGDGNPRNDRSDGDGVPDYLDDDDDDDGRLTRDEDADGSGSPLDDDFDNDGLEDYVDRDDDNDGVPSAFEVGDTDGDGDEDRYDLDDDNDGIPTVEEDPDGDGNILEHDRDDDGQPDYVDDDDDGDEIPTVIEGTEDTDGDGRADYLDLDSDGDGFEDRNEGTPDSDGDGYADYRDPDDDDDSLMSRDEADQDTDGDGLADRIDPDDDNDGLVTSVEVMDAAEFGEDVDRDGLPNWLDVDADGDGILDQDEPLDEDQDGIPDYLDSAIPNAWFEAGCGGCASTGSMPQPHAVLALMLLCVARRRVARAATKL